MKKRSLLALALALGLAASPALAAQHDVDDPDLEQEQEFGQEYERDAEPGLPGAPVEPLPEVEPAPLPEVEPAPLPETEPAPLPEVEPEPLPELDTDVEQPDAEVPDADLNDVEQSVIEAAETTVELGRFTQAFRDAAIAQDLTDGAFTIFAPTDAAFELAAFERGMTVDEFLASDEVREGFGAFVVEGRWTLSDLFTEVEGTGEPVTLQTLNGETLVVTLVGDTLMINDVAVVISPDLEAHHHIILHTVDAVLLQEQL